MSIQNKQKIFLVFLALLLSVLGSAFSYAATNPIVELELNKEYTLTAPLESYDTKALENRLSKYHFKAFAPYTSVYKIKVSPDTRYTLKTTYPGDKSISQLEVIGENPYSKSTSLLTYADLTPKIPGFVGGIDTLKNAFVYKSNFNIDASSTGLYIYIIAYFQKPEGTLKMRLSSPNEDDKTVSFTDANASGTVFTSPLKLTKMPDDTQQLKIAVNSTDAFINGSPQKLPIKPFIDSSTTMVPLRFIAEKLGATVEWRQKDEKITYKREQITIELWLDKKTAIVNGKEESLTIAPYRVGQYTVVPLRFVVEKLGANLQWFEKNQEIIITY